MKKTVTVKTFFFSMARPALLLTFALLIAASFPVSLLVGALAGKQAIQMRKFDANLQQRLTASAAEEELMVYVWTGAASPGEIDAELRATFGISLDAYENEEVYESATLPALLEEAAAKLREPQVQTAGAALFRAGRVAQTAGSGATDTAEDVSYAQALKAAVPVLGRLTDKTLIRCAEQGMDFAEVYALAKQKEFIACRRASVKTILHTTYGKVLSALEGDFSVLSCFDYVSCMLLRAGRETVYRLGELPQVSFVSLYTEENWKPSLAANNSHQGDMHIPEARNLYSGVGVTVGVLESATVRKENNVAVAYTGGCDPEAWMLQGADVRWYDGNFAGLVRESYSIHSTAVCSEIVGQMIFTESGPFVGVLPDASVIGYSVGTDNQEFAAFGNGLQYLIDEGAEVINISMGLADSFTYGNLDLMVDRTIIQNRVTIVVAAGNRGEHNPAAKISSPSHAYNAIVVGNADSDFYQMNESSAYQQEDCPWETNKPDICASGTGICIPIENLTESLRDTGTIYKPCISEVYTSLNKSGTSLAAPFVTGVVGQMFEANSFLRTNHVLTKALLLAAADSDTLTISGVGNAVVSDSLGLRQKSGAGFLNAARAVTAAMLKNYGGTVVDLKDQNDLGVLTTFSKPKQLTLAAGQTVRFVLCFDRPENSIITVQYPGNIDLNITKDNVTVATATSRRHNVEVVECTASSAGVYRFQLVLSGYTRMAADAKDYQYMLAYCAFVIM